LFDADKVIEKYQKNLEFRTKYNLDTCIGIEYPEKDSAMELYPKGYVGVDKIGRPLYVERLGKLRYRELAKLIEEERMFNAFY